MAKKVCFYHIRDEKNFFREKEEFTVALARNKISFLMGEVPILRKLILQIGLAVVHPNDRFVKRIGREVSTKKMMYEDFELVSYDQEGGMLYKAVLENKYNVYLMINATTGVIYKVQAFRM